MFAEPKKSQLSFRRPADALRAGSPAPVRQSKERSAIRPASASRGATPQRVNGKKLSSISIFLQAEVASASHLHSLGSHWGVSFAYKAVSSCRNHSPIQRPLSAALQRGERRLRAPVTGLVPGANPYVTRESARGPPLQRTTPACRGSTPSHPRGRSASASAPCAPPRPLRTESASSARRRKGQATPADPPLGRTTTRRPRPPPRPSAWS